MKGKSVFITDAERNFGRPLALAFAREGAIVVTGQCDLGRVDIVVNNVLFPVQSRAFSQVSFEVFKRKIEVELTGSFFLFKAVLPHMIAQQWGRIINFTGAAAFQGTDALRASTERGIIGMTYGIAREYGKYNITANCIGIDGVESERTEDVAFLAVALASERSAHITRQCIFASSGFSGI